MHFVMRQYQVDPAAVETIAQRMRQTITHHFSQILPGFVEYCLIDVGNGRLLALAIFEDQAVAEASAHVAARYVSEHLSKFVVDIPQPTEGTVIVRVTGQAQPPESAP